jgi:hypothetical protein
VIQRIVASAPTRTALRCRARGASALTIAFALAGCGGAGSSTPSTAVTKTQVRFVEGAPLLETLINGVVQPISSPYLTVNGATVASSFLYSTRTQFVPVSSGTLTLVARDSFGNAISPVKTSTALAAGKSYTVILVGSYPKYTALTFEEPAPSANATLALYEASPSFANADFGSFRVSTHSGFKKLGSAHFGSLVTVSLGKNVSDFGGYVGTGTNPLPSGALSLASVASLDTKNVLPFNDGGRLSLFVFDPAQGSVAGPVFGSLDL